MYETARSSPWMCCKKCLKVLKKLHLKPSFKAVASSLTYTRYDSRAFTALNFSRLLLETPNETVPPKTSHLHLPPLPRTTTSEYQFMHKSSSIHLSKSPFSKGTTSFSCECTCYPRSGTRYPSGRVPVTVQVLCMGGMDREVE